VGLVEELYRMSEKPEKVGPQSPPPPKSQELLGETDTITVKGVTLQNSDMTKHGHPWKLYKITDTFDQHYFTSHIGFLIGETYVVDWQWKMEGEKKWRTIPNKHRPHTTRRSMMTQMISLSRGIFPTRLSLLDVKGGVMPKFYVTFERIITSTAERTITARTEAQARQKAEEMVSEQKITDWEEQDDDIQITGVEEA